MDSPANLDALTDKGRAIIESFGRASSPKSKGSGIPWWVGLLGFAILVFFFWNRNRPRQQRSQSIIMPQTPPPQVTPSQPPPLSDEEVIAKWDRIFKTSLN